MAKSEEYQLKAPILALQGTSNMKQDQNKTKNRPSIYQRSRPSEKLRQSSYVFNASEFLPFIEKKTQQCNVALPVQVTSSINEQHPSMATTTAFTAIIREFDNEMLPQFQRCGNQTLLNMYVQFRERNEQMARKINTERRNIIGNSEDVKEREHHQDAEERNKAYYLSAEIKEQQADFNCKKTFKEFARNNFADTTQKVNQFISQGARKIQPEVVNQRFGRHYDAKVADIERQFAEHQATDRRNMLFLLKEAAKINRLKEEGRLWLHRQQLRQDLQVKRAVCSQLGSWVGLVLTPHQYFSQR